MYTNIDIIYYYIKIDRNFLETNIGGKFEIVALFYCLSLVFVTDTARSFSP